MVKDNIYMKLGGDLAGSMAKNRFRLEMLYGIRKIFEIYGTEEEFYVIFDYKCDIEIHIKDTFEFYQLKTEKDGKIFTLNDITKVNKAGKSILGKLYNLKKQCEENKQGVKIALVSNRPLKVDNDKLYNKIEEVEFSTFEDSTKQIINKKLTEELIVNDINYDDMWYIYTNMNLIEPENDIISGLVKLFEDVKKVKYIKVGNLYKLIYSCVSEKACYENECRSYQEVLEKKALSKKQFDEMINMHIETSTEIVQKIAEDYKQCTNVKERVDRMIALGNVVDDLNNNNLEIKNIEKEIVVFIEEDKTIFDAEESEIINKITNVFSERFSIIYSKYYQETLVRIIINNSVEGMYEKTCN